MAQLGFKRLLKSKVAAGIATAALSLGCMGSASASLVFMGTYDGTGEGYGNVNNILSLHKSGGAGGAGDVEAGTVSWDGTQDVKTGDYDLTNPNKTATQTFATIGLSGSTAAADLRLFWDPSEVGSSAGDDTQVDQLVMSIFAPDGTLLFSASLAAPVHHNTLGNPGLGGGDFVYGLDATQAAGLQAALDGVGDFSQYRIGLHATVSYVDDGPDTWFVGKKLGGNGNHVPEPGALSLAALGLFGAAMASRRRRNG